MSYSEIYPTLPYFQVNSFSDKPFSGNPAGVCPLAEWPEDQLMQKIAAENNLSETAFFVPRGENKFHLRWFTPTTEVEFCGHATLASGFVLLNIFNPELSEVLFETRIGKLSVRRGGKGFLIMNVPRLPGKEVKLTPDLARLFSKRPDKALKSKENYLFVFNGGEKEVMALKPDFEAMKKFPKFGFIVTGRGLRADFFSRYFAPNHGVPEDPVTGSAHSVLGPFWAEALGQDRLVARQGAERGGDLVLEMKKGRIDIWAKCFLQKEGAFHLAKTF